MLHDAPNACGSDDDDMNSSPQPSAAAAAVAGAPTAASAGGVTTSVTTVAGTIMVFMAIAAVLIYLQFYFDAWTRRDRQNNGSSQASSRRRRGGGDGAAGSRGRIRGARGVDPELLRSLPVTAYRAGSKESSVECAVCLGELEDGEEARFLPLCGHGFHAECVDTWLASHTTCPLCRLTVAKPDDDDAPPCPALLLPPVPPEPANYAQNRPASVLLGMSADHGGVVMSAGGGRSASRGVLVIEIPELAVPTTPTTPCDAAVSTGSARLRSSFKRLWSFGMQGAGASSSCTCAQRRSRLGAGREELSLTSARDSARKAVNRSRSWNYLTAKSHRPIATADRPAGQAWPGAKNPSRNFASLLGAFFVLLRACANMPLMSPSSRQCSDTSIRPMTQAAGDDDMNSSQPSGAVIAGPPTAATTVAAAAGGVMTVGSVTTVVVPIMIFMAIAAGLLYLQHYFDAWNRSDNQSHGRSQASRRRGGGGASSGRGSVGIARGGLDPDVLRSLPVTVYRSKESLVECAVCLGELEHGEAARFLPRCGHGFHAECVDTWLASHTTCPLCRLTVVAIAKQQPDDASPVAPPSLALRPVPPEPTTARYHAANLPLPASVPNQGAVSTVAMASDDGDTSASAGAMAVLAIEIPEVAVATLLTPRSFRRLWSFGRQGAGPSSSCSCGGAGEGADVEQGVSSA
nr:unnamed protein product [Digitaria exilis]